MFLKVALAAEVKKTTGQTQQQVLSNPQLLNSYAYTANNPVKYTDPDGEFLFLIPAIPYIFTGAVALLGAYSAWQTGQTAGYALEGDYVNSEVSAAKNQLALTAIAALGEGALAVMPLTVTNSTPKGQLVINESARTISVSEGSNIRFTQTTMKSNFSSEPGVPQFFKNRSIDEVANDIRSDKSLASQVRVGYIERNGKMLIVDTRSAGTLQKAGINSSEWNWNKITDPKRINEINQRLNDNHLSSNGTTQIRY